MLEFYLSIKKEGRLAALLHVEPRGGKGPSGAILYPLKAADLRRAGRDLFAAGAESWLCSSSILHPEDYGCRLDVAGLIDEGFNEETEKTNAVKRSLWDKVMAVIDTPTFRASLTPTEALILDREVKIGKAPRSKKRKRRKK